MYKNKHRNTKKQNNNSKKLVIGIIYIYIYVGYSLWLNLSLYDEYKSVVQIVGFPCNRKLVKHLYDFDESSFKGKHKENSIVRNRSSSILIK